MKRLSERVHDFILSRVHTTRLTVQNAAKFKVTGQSLKMNRDFDTLRSLINAVNEQKAEQVQRVRDALESQPIPVPAEFLSLLLELNPQDARSILK